MINQHLIISTYNNPLANLSYKSINSFGLIERDMLEILSKSLNFTYEIIVPTDVQQLGLPLSNGTWVGVLGQLARGEADMTMSIGPPTLSRSQVVDQSFPIISDNLAIMIPYPQLGNDLQLTTSSSTTIIITSILLAVIFVGLLLWIVNRMKNDNKLKKEELLMFLVALTLSQGGFIRPNSLPFRLIQGAWLIALVLILNIYLGTLTSMLMAPHYNFIVNSVEDLATKENVRTLIVKGSPAQGDLSASTLPVHQKIIERIMQNPEKSIIKSVGEYVKILSQEPNQVFILSDIIQGYEISEDFKKVGYCRAITLDKFISTRNNCISLRKKSRYTEDVNRKLLLLRQFGLLQHLEGKYKSVASKRCSVKEVNSGKTRPTTITLSQLRSVFLMFLICCLGCFFVFLIEVIYFFLSKQWRSRIQQV